jgi:hypothetical protein
MSVRGSALGARSTPAPDPVDHRAAVECLVDELENVQAGLEREDLPAPEPCDREQILTVGSVQLLEVHPAAIRPADVHLGEGRGELGFGCAVRASSARRSQVEEDLGRRTGVETGECAIKDVQPACEQHDQLSVRTPVGPHAPSQARAKPLGRLRSRAEAIEVFGLGEQLEPVGPLPEPGLRDRRQGVPFARLGSIHGARDPLQLGKHVLHRRLVASRGARESRQPHPVGLVVALGRLRLRIGIDEDDLDPIA